MPFTSQNPRHQHFFKVPALVVDTCALTWFARRAEGLSELTSLITSYRLLVPTTVLYELAFGLPEVIGPQELEIRKLLFDRAHEVDMLQYVFQQQRGVVRPGSFSIVNPGYNEWWTARERVLQYVKLTESKARDGKRSLSMDALIHACARNCFAPVCTENVGDFKKLNRAGAQRSYDGTVPLFTPQDALDSLTRDVSSREEG